MKKLLAIVIALTLALLLFGCTVEEKPNGIDPVDVDAEPENAVVYNLNPVGMMPEVLHFEIPARGEKAGVDISFEYNLDGRLINAKTFSGDIYVVGILSNTEIILDDIALTHQPHQLYRLDLETKEAEPLLSEEVYGHTYDEYYDSVTKKWTWLDWCENPALNGTRDGTEKPLIAYYSNKYAEDGVITNEENCWEYGAIWILDLETGEETRIPSPDGSEISGGARIRWHGTKDVLFETSVDGVTHYIKYSTDTGEYLTAELSHDDICSFIDANLVFDEFINSGSEGLDKSDSIGDEYEPFYRVTDERFDTPEKLEEYIETYFHESYILNDINSRVTVQDGKVYRPESEWEHNYNKGYRFEIILIYEDQIRVNVYTELKDDPDFIQIAWYCFLKEDGKWKIGWVDRNCHARDGWSNKDDFTDIPITAEEISSLLEKDLYMWARTNSWTFAICEPGVPFDDGDPANYIEKDVGGWTYYYYKVIDPDYDTWDKWEALIGSIYADEEFDSFINNLAYTNIDGALYTIEGGGRGYYEDRGNYAWHVTDYTDDSVTVQRRFGDTSENCETIYSEWITMSKTPDGWRISRASRVL